MVFGSQQSQRLLGGGNGHSFQDIALLPGRRSKYLARQFHAHRGKAERALELGAGELICAASGLLNLNADGSFAYTPNLDFTGTDSFTYRCLDGFTCDEARVSVYDAGFMLGVERVEILVETLVRGLPRVDCTADRGLRHHAAFPVSPKNRGPDQWAPVISRAMADMSVCRNSTVIPLLSGQVNVSFFCTGGITWGRNHPQYLTSGWPWPAFGGHRYCRL